MLTNLKAVRLASGLKQSEVAEKIGISLPWYSLLENGRFVPTDPVKKKIAEVFGESVDELLKPVSLSLSAVAVKF